MAPPSSSWRSTRPARPTRSERKVEICERAYKLLVADGFPPEDIIFDPNIFAVATGIDEHRRYALDFIEACARNQARCPHVHISGGLSNLSFSFRGNEPVRRAMHSVFLYHAIPAGLDMAIVNAGQLDVYDTIDPELREACEDVILDRRDDATERLVTLAERFRGTDAAARRPAAEWRALPLGERDQPLGRIVAAVEDDVLARLAKLGIDRVIDVELAGVDDAHVHARPGWRGRGTRCASRGAPARCRGTRS